MSWDCLVGADFQTAEHAETFSALLLGPASSSTERNSSASAAGALPGLPYNARLSEILCINEYYGHGFSIPMPILSISLSLPKKNT